MSKFQKNIDGTLLFYNKPSLNGEVHLLKEDSDVTGVWFTGASSH